MLVVPAVVAGAVAVPDVAVVEVAAGAAVDVDAPPKRLGVPLLDAVPGAVVGAVPEDAAAVVAGGFPKSDGVWVGAAVAADVVVVAVVAVVAGAVVVVAENKVEGFDAGVEPLPRAPPPKPAKEPRPGDAVVAGALLAGAVVVAGLAPNSDGVVVPGAVSAGFEVDVAPPKRLDAGVDEAPLVEAENRPGFCVDAEVEAAPPPKRFDPELLAASCEAGVVVDPPNRFPLGFEAPPNRLEAGFDSA